MSRRRLGTCTEPGPYATHCTQDVGHRYSCYDAGDDSSWNDRSPEDWQTDTPHACGDPECPDNPVPVMCTGTVDCTADEHMVCCPSTEREPISDRAADAILGLVDTDRRLREPAIVHIEPVLAGPGHADDPTFTSELQTVTCEACRAGVVATVRAAQPRERQTWERPVVPGTDPTRDPVAMRLLLEVDGDGKARVHEAILGQLLIDAGWERTA